MQQQEQQHSLLRQHAHQFCGWFTQQRLSLSPYISSQEEFHLHSPHFCIVHVPMDSIDDYCRRFLLPILDMKSSSNSQHEQHSFNLFKTLFCKILHDEFHINIVPTSNNNNKLHFKRFVVLSDSHSQEKALYPKTNGDILLHCGDFTNGGSLEVYFFDYFYEPNSKVEFF
ncbi:hypothetical protein FDP41_013736 [Naegleria fowleri]|uniref:Calcineurin-like phosphoesterase domain-containing protein n=1 Tax=Naegleria fowleri TaxID=5763 RepID=A0A6A5C153_NAEFO|nr:uncharacterized protein FDP41_013736 [Naegleria fowleri]KAF0980522.1 hypothetical protein FDP41_013736 [Naegleria fowleri]